MRRLILVRNKIFNFHHLINVILVKAVGLKQDTVLTDVLIAEVMVVLEQTKDFLLFNKHVLKVQEVVRKLLTRVVIVMGRETNKLQKNYL